MLNQLLPDRLEFFLEKHINKSYSFFLLLRNFTSVLYSCRMDTKLIQINHKQYNDFIDMQYRAYNIKSECELTGVGERIT